MNRVKGNALADAEIDAALDVALAQLDKLEVAEQVSDSSSWEVPPYQSGTRRVARNLPPLPGSARTRAVPPLPSFKPPFLSSKPRARPPEPVALPLGSGSLEPRPRRWLIVLAAGLGLSLIAAGLALGAAQPTPKNAAKSRASAPLPERSLSGARTPSTAPLR